MIPEFEKEILSKIGYTDKYLEIQCKYIDDGLNTPIFKKEDIRELFKEFKVKFISKGSRHTYSRKHNEFEFQFCVVVRKNLVDVYNYIFENGEILDNRVVNMGSILRYLPYDKTLADSLNSKGFDLNSIQDLKNYVIDMKGLFNEFVDKYVLILSK